MKENREQIRFPLEVEVGDTIEFDEGLVCCKSKGISPGVGRCGKCFLNGDWRCSCFVCTRFHRKDGQYVYFEKVGKEERI